MPGGNLRSNLALSFVAVLLAAAVGETGLRLLIRPHADCYGEVLGIDLPPCRLRSPYEAAGTIADRSEPYDDLVVGGKRITIGDLWGIARYDSVIGFAPRENAVSANGWWRTNEHGARIGRAGDDAADSAATRILVLGDSYAAGSRLPFEETWSAVLDELSPELDVINFAMDGYGMAQAHVRYLSVRDEVRHDVVLMMFVPEEDLWRDVNVRRDVGANWPMYRVLPRYVLDGDELRLIRSPFPDQAAGRPAQPRETDRRLRAHLREFDRFYWEPWWGEPPGPPRPALYRLMVAVVQELKTREIRHSLMDPKSEAMRISRAIFRTLRNQTLRDGRRFVLAVLPTEYALMDADEAFWRRWERMIEAVCVEGSPCIDLSDPLRALPKEAIDRGYDGSHFGPRVNREIARILAEHLTPGP